MSATEKLREAIAAVERSIATTERRLQSDIDRDPFRRPGEPVLTPDDMKDMHGRYILLDARTALVNGLSALAEAEKRS